MSTWLAAAASLVVGIGIGFASGYRAGQGTISTPVPGASGRPFSESTVEAPVRLEEEPTVPAPDPSAERAGSAPAKPAGSAPTAPDRRGTRPTESVSVGRVPPTVDPISGGPTAPAVADGPGSLQVLSRPAGAQVILDGRPVGKTPVTIPEVRSGPHEVRLELPGFNRWATTVDVQAGKPARVAASLEQ